MQIERTGWLGILNLQIFNNALLGKWWWKLTSGVNWYGQGIFKENYFKTSPEWNLYHKQCRRRSFFWNGILHSLHAFRKNISPCVKNGATTLFWLDNWVEGKAPADIWPNLFQLTLTKEESIRDFTSRMSGFFPNDSSD